MRVRRFLCEKKKVSLGTLAMVVVRVQKDPSSIVSYGLTGNGGTLDFSLWFSPLSVSLCDCVISTALESCPYTNPLGFTHCYCLFTTLCGLASHQSSHTIPDILLEGGTIGGFCFALAHEGKGE